MNGVHDMGGMHGMGAVQAEKDEPVFHARWQGRISALDRVVRGKWNAGASRHQKELIPPAEYLRIGYFERVLIGLTGLASARSHSMCIRCAFQHASSGESRQHRRTR